jgi:hypothetical protein
MVSPDLFADWEEINDLNDLKETLGWKKKKKKKRG